MIALALELSTARGSLALFADGRVAAAESWDEKAVRGQQAFRALPGLLANAGIRVEDIDVFIAGRGPGQYSGLRVAVTTAQALALPGTKTVYTVSSGEALALEMAGDESARQIAIVGDARRNTLWLGLFEKTGDRLKTITPWTIVTPDQLASHLPAGAVLAGPDWKRLEPVLGKMQFPNVRVIREDRSPKAEFVGRVALQKLRVGIPSEPMTPIYMHPAVAG